MVKFSYKAMDIKGRIIKGQMEADNIEALESSVRHIGLDLISFSEVATKSWRMNQRIVLSNQEMITLCFQLEQATRSGIPLVTAMRDLSDSVTRTGFRELLITVLGKIEGGSSLSESMAQFPHSFDGVFITLIHVGERTGTLGTILIDIIEDLKWRDELAEKTRKLLIYPAFMLLVLAGIFVFVMTFLVPQLVSLLAMMKQELPFHTQLLISTSAFVSENFVLILGICATVFVVVKVGRMFSAGMCYLVDYLKLKMFVLGPITYKIILVRFASSFALMYKSGITVLEAISLNEALAGNVVVAKAMAEASDAIRAGESIYASFEKTGMFPPLVLRMIQVGEHTGALDTALENVRYFYDREVKQGVDQVQSVIGPFFTIIIGGLLAWVVVSILGPIYDVIGNVKM